MTIRGGGHPKQAMVLTPVSRLGPPPRSFAADAHDCIMVRSLWTYRIQGCGAILRARWQAPLGPFRCPTKKITGARSKSALTENVPYKACSTFTRVAACTLALSPYIVTRHELPRISGKAATIPDFDGLDGYRNRRKKVNRYVIRRDAFNSLFASGTQRALVVEWLIQKQRITLATPKASAGAPSPEPQGQFIWPDDKRRRSFQILWPRNEEAVEATSKQSGAE